VLVAVPFLRASQRMLSNKGLGAIPEADLLAFWSVAVRSTRGESTGVEVAADGFIGLELAELEFAAVEFAGLEFTAVELAVVEFAGVELAGFGFTAL